MTVIDRFKRSLSSPWQKRPLLPAFRNPRRRDWLFIATLALSLVATMTLLRHVNQKRPFFAFGIRLVSTHQSGIDNGLLVSLTVATAFTLAWASVALLRKIDSWLQHQTEFVWLFGRRSGLRSARKRLVRWYHTPRSTGQYLVKYGNPIALSLASAGLALGGWTIAVSQGSLARESLPRVPSSPNAASKSLYALKVARAQARQDGLRKDRDAWLKVSAALIASGGGLLALGKFELSRLERERADSALAADRFTKAVELLAQSEQQAQQLGGVFSLEQLALSAEEYQRTVVQVLCAFLRSSIPEIQNSTRPQISDPRPMLYRPSEPVRAAIGVLRKNQLSEGDLESDEYVQHKSHMPGPFDLTGAFLADLDLQGMNLTYSDLEAADLTHARLSSAHLGGCRAVGASLVAADLTWANLGWGNFDHANLQFAQVVAADLRGASFMLANLRGASLGGSAMESTRFFGSSLAGADFRVASSFYALGRTTGMSGAWLSRCDLRGANFDGVNLSNAWLLGADLRGTDLSGAILEGAKLDGLDAWGDDFGNAIHDDSTRWPVGFSPPPSGVAQSFDVDGSSAYGGEDAGIHFGVASSGPIRLRSLRSSLAAMRRAFAGFGEGRTCDEASRG